MTAYNGDHFTSHGDRQKHLNERARSHWTLRKLVEDDEIALPRHQRLFDQLIAVNWTPKIGVKVQIERKAVLKHRLGRFPDKGNGVVMGFSGVKGRRAKILDFWRIWGPAPQPFRPRWVSTQIEAGDVSVELARGTVGNGVVRRI